MRRPLTVTSYAVLAQLAMRPRTPYELATWMARNLRFFWPRAASRIYDEPKQLVASGHAIARIEPSGLRRRTVYAITAKGRRALRSWYDTPTSQPVLEFEGLLRVFFGANTSPRALRSAVASAKLRADDIQQAGREVAAEYLAGRAPFPERVHLSGVTFDFLWNYADLLRRWAGRADEELRRWRDTTAAGKEARALRVFREALSKPSV